MYERSLAITRAVLGEEAFATSLDAADTYNNIGEVYKAQGRLSEALEMYERCQTMMREVLGEEAFETHLDVAYTDHNIGKVHHAQNHLPEALEMFKHSLDITRDKLGEEVSPYMGLYISSIGLVYIDQGDLDDAETSLRKALAIFEAAGLVAEHEYVREARSGLERIDERSFVIVGRERLEPWGSS